MQRTVLPSKLYNSKGLTLVEVLIALIIFLFISLALMQTALMSINANMVSALRDEAVRVAEERMNEARSFPFPQNDLSHIGLLYVGNDGGALPLANCSANFIGQFPAGGLVVQRPVRSISAFNFCTNRTVLAVPDIDNPTSARVTVTVGWQWKGQDYVHSISTLIMIPS